MPYLISTEGYVNCLCVGRRRFHVGILVYENAVVGNILDENLSHFVCINQMPVFVFEQHCRKGRSRRQEHPTETIFVDDLLPIGLQRGYFHVLVAPCFAIHVRTPVEKHFILGPSGVDDIITEFLVVEHVSLELLSIQKFDRGGGLGHFIKFKGDLSVDGEYANPLNGDYRPNITPPG